MKTLVTYFGLVVGP